MTERIQQSQWGQLSTELWNMVFEHLQQSELLRLPTVCKKFSQVFDCHPHLMNSFNIEEYVILTLEQVWSLALWIRRHSRGVRHFKGLGGPARIENVLLLLHSHQAAICSMAVRISQEMMPLVVDFKTLTECSLSSPMDQMHSLSLEALRGLPSLTALRLEESDFTHVEAAVHLTRLELIRGCEAECSHDCMCVTSLVQLQLNDSVLKLFHNEGLAACTCLKHIDVRRGSVQAVDAAETLTADENAFDLPVSLTALTSLTSMVLSCSDVDRLEPDLDCLSCLVNLQSLVVECYGMLTFTQGLTCLTALTKLSIEVVDVSDIEKKVSLFDWAGLISLVHLHILGNVWLTYQYPLSRLASLNKLRTVVFKCFYRPNQDMTGQLAVLAYKLGRDRRDVYFDVGQPFYE